MVNCRSHRQTDFLYYGHTYIISEEQKVEENGGIRALNNEPVQRNPGGSKPIICVMYGSVYPTNWLLPER